MSRFSIMKLLKVLEKWLEYMAVRQCDALLHAVCPMCMIYSSIFFLERAGELCVVVLIDRKNGPEQNAESMAWISFSLHSRLKRCKQPHTLCLDLQFY